jgi:hypothetical protein
MTREILQIIQDWILDNSRLEDQSSEQMINRLFFITGSIRKSISESKPKKEQKPLCRHMGKNVISAVRVLMALFEPFCRSDRAAAASGARRRGRGVATSDPVPPPRRDGRSAEKRR